MRISLPLLLAILCVLPAVEPDDAGGRSATVAFEARPARISLMRSRSWMANGKAYEHSDFAVSIAFLGPAELLVVGWRDPVVEAAVSDSGEQLRQRRSDSRERMSCDPDVRRARGTDHPLFEAQFRLEQPAKPCNGLALIRGRVTAQVAVGAPRRAELKPYKGVRGKLLEIEGVPGAEVTVDKGSSAEEVALRYPEALQDRLVSVTFIDGAGREIRCNGWSLTSNSNEIERSYRVKLPEDGGVVLGLIPGTRLVEMPFELKDILLSAPAGKDGRDRVKVVATEGLTAEPVEAAEPVLKTKELIEQPGF